MQGYIGVELQDVVLYLALLQLDSKHTRQGIKAYVLAFKDSQEIGKTWLTSSTKLTDTQIEYHTVFSIVIPLTVMSENSLLASV